LLRSLLQEGRIIEKSAGLSTTYKKYFCLFINHL